MKLGFARYALRSVALAAVAMLWAAALPAIAAPAPTGLAWSCPDGPFGKPVPDGAKVTRLDKALPSDANVEGPVWLSGALFVSEFGEGANPPPTRVLQIVAGVGVVYAADAGTNGLAADSAGRLHGASHKLGAIVRFGLPGAEPKVIVAGYKGQRFNSPNDLAIRSDGTIYFTDPTWQAPSRRATA